MSERELDHIRRAQRDPRAFGPLYDAYVDLVWKYAISRLGDAALADDATSQTFVKAIAALPRFRPQVRDGESSFRPWLMQIARNVVMDELRRRAPAPLTLLERIPASGNSPEDIALSSDEIAIVRSALAQLPAKERQIVVMRAHGAPVEEIATAMGISPSAVKSAHWRAHQRLQVILERHDPRKETG